MRRLISNFIRTAAIAAMSGLIMGSLLPTSARAQAESELTISTGERPAHLFPTPERAAIRASSNLGTATGAALLYNGGPVMVTTTTYAIFWVPSTLQTGASTGMSSRYQIVQAAFLSLYPGHGLANNNTQYYMTQRYSLLTSVTSYIQNVGSFGGSYVDTSAYPTSGCSDPYTPGNCLSDSQIQAEIQKVMTLKGWTGGLNKMFFLFTSSGEGSCIGYACAYSYYCAYHSYFYSGTTPVIYGNEPYANNYCQLPGTPSPNGDSAADSAASVASHELTEAITDPLINAWKSSSGEEIGDLCAWNYGTNGWDSGNANQDWFTYVRFPYLISNPPIGVFELQQEYDNHAGGCVQLGP